MKKTVFLSGPIRGIPRELSLGWRNDATKLLKKNFNVLHALRGREKKETLVDPRAAVIRDLSDIQRADILLVNDTLDNCSMIGTSMEVFSAFNQNKPVIIFGHAHDGDYWLNYHSHLRVDDLRAACEVIDRMYK